VGGAQHCLSRPKHGEITASLRLDAKVCIRPPDWSTGTLDTAQILPRGAPRAVTCTASRRRSRPQYHYLARRRSTACSEPGHPRGLPGAHRYECPTREPDALISILSQISDTACAARRGDAFDGASTLAASHTSVSVATRVATGGRVWRGAAGVLLLAQLRGACGNVLLGNPDT